MTIRRVVTGTACDGRSVVARDDRVEPVTVSALPGYSWHKLWEFDERPKDPADSRVHTGLSHFPPPDGVRFNIYTVPPSSTVRPPLTEAARHELGVKLPGRGEHMESDQAGMHRTASVDLVIVLAGKISLDLDDGVSVDLQTGDTLVQNGTRHSWRNDSDAPCTMAVVLLGASAQQS